MEKNKLLREFEERINSKRTEIEYLQSAYLLKYAENEIIQALFHELGNETLREKEFYSERTCLRKGIEIAKGERITKYSDIWLLSKEDFDEYQKLWGAKCRKEGLLDAEGRYTEETKTEQQLSEIKEKLIKLSVELLPNDFPNKGVLTDAIIWKGRNSYTIREKLFELIMRIK